MGGDAPSSGGSPISISTGDEITGPANGGIISSPPKGGAHFILFSFDVKIEGKGVDRHIDILGGGSTTSTASTSGGETTTTTTQQPGDD